ncbi:MAG: caspase family protein [Cyclobacteriaceae bacterium]
MNKLILFAIVINLSMASLDAQYRHYANGIRSFQNGHMEASINNLTRYLNGSYIEDKFKVDAHYVRGLANRALENNDKAIPDFMISIDLYHPNEKNINWLIAQSYSKIADYANAIKFYNNTLPLFSLDKENTIKILLEALAVYEKVNEPKQARSIALKILNTDRSNQAARDKLIKLNELLQDTTGVSTLIALEDSKDEPQVTKTSPTTVEEVTEESAAVALGEEQITTAPEESKLVTYRNKLALVIGNASYQHSGSLKNPVNDARSMSNKLDEIGFDVIYKENASQNEMKSGIREFGQRLDKYEVGLFYYAGHGVQVNGKNYMIPIEANLEMEAEVEFDCVDTDRVLAYMDYSDTKVNIVILDACRNNPFERSWSRSANSSGLAFMNAPSGSLIAYATAPGSTASDGEGDNGLYTSMLLKHMDTPGITIEQFFKRVRSEVNDKSNNKQIPWESTSLTGDFYFTVN